MIRIAMADDHAIVREGLKRILDKTADLAVTGDVGTADELLTLLRTQSFDVVVLDLTLGPRSGLELLKQVRSEFPHLPVLILSMHTGEEFALRALRAGAVGYVQKESAPEELVTAVRRAVALGTSLNAPLAQPLATEPARGGGKVPQQTHPAHEHSGVRLLAPGNARHGSSAGF